MRLFHICKFQREDKDGVHCGGVEKFAMYLQRAVPEVDLISWTDYPHWIDRNNLADFEKAKLLNDWLLASGELDQDSTVVVDGYWGRGLEGKVKRLISVCHGSYAGRLVQYLINPWGENISDQEIREQKHMWSDPSTEIVSVSHASAIEIAMLCDRTSTVISHGVDLDIYKPLGYERQIYMHAATSLRKGTDIIEMLGKDYGLPISFMGIKSGNMVSEAKRLNSAKVLIAPTRHEGNSYLLIEALACGAPVLTYATGLAIDFDNRCGKVIDDFHPTAFALALKRTDWESKDPRAWAEQNADFEMFAEKWRDYLYV